MSAWHVPARESLLPVLPEQSCAVCGDQDWAWLYFLLSAPDWVQTTGWFANWFMVLCATCHEHWPDGQRGVLIERWRAGHDEDRPGLDEYMSVVTAMQSEPPLPRVEVSSGS